MRNMSKLEDNGRYYNWYHGYTEIRPHDYYSTIGFSRFEYIVNTAASSGTIATKHFGDKFDADKVETKLWYRVHVFPPDSVRNNTNVTLHLDIEKVSLKDLTNGHDTLNVEYTTVETSQKSFNFSPPAGGSWGIIYGFKDGAYYMELERHALPGDVRKQKLNLMPGFRFTWHYSGMEWSHGLNMSTKTVQRLLSGIVPIIYKFCL